MRLNKYIAHHTKHSRREADTIIFNKKVSINGKIVDTPAVQVDDISDKVILNGSIIKKKDNYTIIIYNKAKGELVTKKDTEGRKTIFHSLHSKYSGFTPIGRLDYTSEGLLILTDAPDIADILMKSDLEREYKIKIRGTVTPIMENAMKEGLHLDDARAGGHEKSKIISMDFAPFVRYTILKNTPNYSILKIVLKEGKNREIRRFYAHFNAEVVDLKRLSYGKLGLNALPTGKTKFLSLNEYEWVRSFVAEYKKKN